MSMKQVTTEELRRMKGYKKLPLLTKEVLLKSLLTSPFGWVSAK